MDPKRSGHQGVGRIEEVETMKRLGLMWIGAHLPWMAVSWWGHQGSHHASMAVVTTIALFITLTMISAVCVRKEIPWSSLNPWNLHQIRLRTMMVGLGVVTTVLGVLLVMATPLKYWIVWLSVIPPGVSAHTIPKPEGLIQSGILGWVVPWVVLNAAFSAILGAWVESVRVVLQQQKKEQWKSLKEIWQLPSGLILVPSEGGMREWKIHGALSFEKAFELWLEEVNRGKIWIRGWVGVILAHATWWSWSSLWVLSGSTMIGIQLGILILGGVWWKWVLIDFNLKNKGSEDGCVA